MLKSRYLHAMLAAVGALLCLGAAASEEALRAFPGAEGFGAYAAGGRGGAVLFVENLRDYDPDDEAPIPGSLRAACMAEGPRTILFRVGGTIRLKAPLVITEPYLTVAGESAPGGGICIADHGVQLLDSHDIIVRHVRFRPGDRAGRRLADEGIDWSTDALWIARCRDVILDHCSASWGSDETLSVTRSTDVTVQWCFITESLNRSTHAKGRHGYGGLVAYMCDGRASQHHNLWAYHFSRSPRPGSGEDCAEPGLLFDFRNNVVFMGGRGYSAAGKDNIRMNFVGNYIEEGKGFVATPGVRIYHEDNLLDGSRDDIIIGQYQNCPSPFDVAPVATHSARQARELVLSSAGATAPSRDAVDRRVVEWVREGRGGLIDSQQEVGGWPQLRSGEAPADSDKDGMADAWERARGLDPAKADQNGDDDGDGYTNLEEYLHALARGEG